MYCGDAKASNGCPAYGGEPPGDLLLAGHALVSSLILVTANIKEFKRVPGLTLEDWQT